MEGCGSQALKEGDVHAKSSLDTGLSLSLGFPIHGMTRKWCWRLWEGANSELLTQGLVIQEDWHTVPTVGAFTLSEGHSRYPQEGGWAG